MNNRFSTDGNYKLWVLLHQVKDIIFRAREKELRLYGITPMEAATLFVLFKMLGGKSSANKISEVILRKPHTVAGYISRMERDGLVTKSKDKNQEGIKIIQTTQKGKQVYTQSTKRESINKILSCLSEEEHQQLWSILEKLRESGLNNLPSVERLPFP
ncbi:unnamed protein product [marine sediment metagenome]|uniref:HTH marR-type domain-containing protein n=1 Tax=marine sediment metagenome TaxID=412755 RepID=X0S7Q7_9ZZZZ